MNRDLREVSCIYRNILHMGSAGLFRHVHSGEAIESIRGMIYRTAIDETELREMGNSAIRKLEQMTDEEYEDMDIYDISDAL